MGDSRSIYEAQTILDSITDGFLILDKNWDISYSNKAFETITNISREKNIYKNIWEVVKIREVVLLKKECEEAISLQASREMELRLSATGQWLHVKIYPHTDGLILSFHDITQKKEQQDRIFLDEHNLRILIDITEHPIWLVDKDLKILLCNTAFKAWIRHFTGVEMGVGDYVLASNLNKSYLDRFKMCYNLAFMGKSFNAVEDMKVDGEQKFSTITFNPAYDSEKEIMGVSCFATDITAQRLNLNKLEAQTQLLMEIADIQSHKVRGPVATILGLSQVFNYADPSDPNNIEVLQGITSVAEKLDTIVKEVIRNVNRLSRRRSMNTSPNQDAGQ